MDWSVIITGVFGLLGGGSVVYMLLDKKVSSAKEKVETAEGAIPLYKEIRTIVKEEVEPLREELEYLKLHYCCYRDDCEMRILMPYKDKEDATE